MFIASKLRRNVDETVIKELWRREIEKINLDKERMNAFVCAFVNGTVVDYCEKKSHNLSVLSDARLRDGKPLLF